MLQPGEHLERYEVVEPLGHGGHAAVYLLKHRTLGSLHALKVLSLPRPDLRERLIQEGRIQANLAHPNIVPVTDVLDVRGTPALLMPYVDGPELGEWIERRQPLQTTEITTVFSAIVSAVAVAHSRGLVHRDLKPANVLVAGRAGEWVPRVTDFGIAKIVLEELAEHPGLAGGAKGLTRTGVGLGTPAYMAPEQVVDAAKVDQRADVFALGCILHEMVSGQRLFRGPHPLNVAAQIASSEPADLRAVPRDLPAALLAALCGCVEKSLEARIPSCSVLLAVLRGERTWAHPPLPERPPPNSPTASASAFLTPARPTLSVTATPMSPLLAPSTPPSPLPPAPGPARPWGLIAVATAGIALGVAFLANPQTDARSSGVFSEPQPPASKVEEAIVEPATQTPPLPDDPLPATVTRPPRPPPPPSKRVETAPSPAKGTLELNSLPASTLYVDGTQVGHGGTELSLVAGTYTVRFRHDASGNDYTLEVKVPDNDSIFVCYDFDLKKPC